MIVRRPETGHKEVKIVIPPMWQCKFVLRMREIWILEIRPRGSGYGRGGDGDDGCGYKWY